MFWNFFFINPFLSNCLKYGLSHLTSSCSSALLSEICVNPPFLLCLLVILMQVKLNMKLFHHDDHNLSCWQMLPHCHSCFLVVFFFQHHNCPSTSMHPGINRTKTVMHRDAMWWLTAWRIACTASNCSKLLSSGWSLVGCNVKNVGCCASLRRSTVCP